MSSDMVYEVARAIEGVSDEQARELANFLANEKRAERGTVNTFTSGIVTHTSGQRHFASLPNGKPITCGECE